MPQSNVESFMKDINDAYGLNLQVESRDASSFTSNDTSNDYKGIVSGLKYEYDQSGNKVNITGHAIRLDKIKANNHLTLDFIGKDVQNGGKDARFDTMDAMKVYRFTGSIVNPQQHVFNTDYFYPNTAMPTDDYPTTPYDTSYTTTLYDTTYTTTY